MNDTKLAIYGGPITKTTPYGTGNRFGLEEAKQLVKKEKKVKDLKAKERKEKVKAKVELFHKLIQMSQENQELCSQRESYI